MEEEGLRSSGRWRPQGSGIFADGSVMAEWASLQPELVQLIAERVLSSSGVDEYMAMRAVCPTWRSAILKPSLHAAVADLRFRPRQWVMLHGADDDEGRPLFLNVSTGRFRRLRLPVLRDYIFVGASDGLLVLGDRERPHAARLLNPLTGDMLPFAVAIPPELLVKAAITSNEPSIIFSFLPYHGEYEDKPAFMQRGGNAVCSADPTGQLRAVKFHNAAITRGLLYVRSMTTLCTVTTYAGNVYVLTYEGTLCKIVWTGGHWYAEPILEIGMKLGCLLESASKLLFVKEKVETIELFSVDVKRKVLEPIESLGSSALFLSYGNNMVVDADMLPSIKRNCIYSNRTDGYVWYDLSDGKKTYVTSPQVPRDGSGAERGIIHEGPLSLAKVLLTPYPKVKAQLDRIQQI